MQRPPSTERLRQLGYPVEPDGSMRLPPLPRHPLGQLPLRDQLSHLRLLMPWQRVAAMYQGELSYAQLSAWAARQPDEVAVIDGEFVYIAAGLPENADAAEEARLVLATQGAVPE
jgi:hypothetical protein